MKSRRRVNSDVGFLPTMTNHMTVRRQIMFVLLVTLVASSSAQPQKFPTASRLASTVDFCDLTIHPKLYVGKLIRVNATYIWWWESSYLYNSQCETDEKKIHNGLDCSGDTECERLSKEVYDHFQYERENVIGPAYRSHVTLVGRLVGPSKRGFGHLNHFKFEFRIREVESASPVEKVHP
jgi:hypothetical protein